MRVLDFIDTTEWSHDGEDYHGRTYSLTLLGVRLSVFAGRRRWWRPPWWWPADREAS
jgi:hypothetical protein